jgi:hypothetical protein
MAGLWGLFGRKAQPDANPLPGIGGDSSPRGRAGEDGFPGSTAQVRTFPGRNPNQPRSTQGGAGDWTTIKADTNYGITPVTQARAQMQADPREFYGGQPLRTRPGYDLAGQNPLSGAAAAGGHSQRDTTTPWTQAQPQISGGVPGSQNVRNSVALRYKAVPGQLHDYLSNARADEAGVVPGGQAADGNVHPDRAVTTVTVPSRFVFAGGGVQTWSVQREMPYGGRGDGARGAILDGERYYVTGQHDQFANAGQGAYGQARLAGPRHRPTVFTEPAPWSTNYYDTTASVGPPDHPGPGGQAPGMVYFSPEPGRASNRTGRSG